MLKNKTNLLINLPESFFRTLELQDIFKYLDETYNVRKTSHDTLEQITKDLMWAETVIMWAWPSITDEVLEQCPKLKFIGHINAVQSSVKACLSHGVAISEARHAWSPSVAELALGLILSGLRKISKFHIEMRVGTEKWINHFPIDIDPSERNLTGRCVGIVGFGRIGQILAQLLAPFHVDLKIYDPYLPLEVVKNYNAKQASVMEIAKSSEVVVLCAANNKGTESIFGQKEIDALGENTVLVNVGRSSLIDMEALVERLRKGDIIAMLDVFNQEPLELESVLRQLPNAFLTPHKAGAVMETVQKSLNMLIYDMEAFVEGKERKNAFTEAMMSSLPD